MSRLSGNPQVTADLHWARQAHPRYLCLNSTLWLWTSCPHQAWWNRFCQVLTSMIWFCSSTFNPTRGFSRACTRTLQPSLTFGLPPPRSMASILICIKEKNCSKHSTFKKHIKDTVIFLLLNVFSFFVLLFFMLDEDFSCSWCGDLETWSTYSIDFSI